MTTTTESAGTPDQMRMFTRRLIGAVNVAEAAIALPWLIAAYGLAERLVAAQERSAPGTVAEHALRWWGPDFAVTLNMSLLIVGAAAGAVGSVVRQSIDFAHHVSRSSLDPRLVWWYLLSPVWSAPLGAVVVVSVNTGLISIGDETTSTAGMTVLVTMGALAGMYTDRALSKLRVLIDSGATKDTQAKQDDDEH